MAVTSPWNRPTTPQAKTNGVYRGGGTGVEADFGARGDFMNAALQNWLKKQNQQSDFNSQWNANIGQGAGLATAAQIAAAKGQLSGAQGGWQKMWNEGNWTPEQEQEQKVQQQQLLQRTEAGQARAFNAGMSQRGMGTNPGAIAALGSSSLWEAAAQKGLLENQIQTQEAGARERGLQGYTGVSSQLAQLEAMPTWENFQANLQSGMHQPDAADNGGNLMDMWDQWRNAPVGPNGWDWNSVQRPTAPSYNSATPDYISGFGGGGARRPTHRFWGNG